MVRCIEGSRRMSTPPRIEPTVCPTFCRSHQWNGPQTPPTHKENQQLYIAKLTTIIPYTVALSHLIRSVLSSDATMSLHGDVSTRIARQQTEILPTIERSIDRSICAARGSLRFVGRMIGWDDRMGSSVARVGPTNRRSAAHCARSATGLTMALSVRHVTTRQTLPEPSRSF